MKMRLVELGGLFHLGAYLPLSTRLAKEASQCAGLEYRLVEATLGYCHIKQDISTINSFHLLKCY